MGNLFPSIILAQGGWITVPAAAFTCRGSRGDWGYFLAPEHYLYVTSGDETNFIAPVVFPPDAQGLMVTELNATVFDDNPDSSVKVILTRVTRYAGISQKVFETSTFPVSKTPGKTRIIDRTGGYRLIDNEKYTWFITFNVSSQFNYTQQRLYCVRIRYQ